MSKIPDEILRLSDEQLRKAFMDRGQPVGPVTDTTRKMYQKKLASLTGGGGASRKSASPKKKKQSLAAMSSEEEEEEEQPPPPPPKAATPKRKSVASVVATPPPAESSSRNRKAAVKQVTPKPKPVSYDTGSDSDEVEPLRDTRRSTTTTYWRQAGPSGSPASNPPFMSDFGKRLSLSYNGHSPARTDLPPKKVPPPAQEGIGHSWVYKFFTIVLPMLLTAFFVYLAYRYAGMPVVPHAISESLEPILKDVEFDKETQIPLCKGTQVPGINCVLSSDVRPSIVNLRLLAPTIKQKYVDAVCYSKDESKTAHVAFDELEALLEARGVSDAESVINNIRVLIRHNPKWGFEIVEQGKAVTLIDPSLPTLCLLKFKIAGFFNVLVVTTAVVGISVVLWWLRKCWTEKSERDEARRTALINRIRDRMESTELTNGPFHFPIDQLRDELLGANNAISMNKVWSEAVASVLKFDPQIRLETKRVGGEEADCLVWIQSRSPQAGRQNQQGQEAAAERSEQTESSSQSSKEQMNKVWQGQAFENVEGSFNSPSVCPTQCLKIRHMFVPDKPAGSEGVVDAILEKCGQNVNILHIKLDTTANDCCVYMKTTSKEDAGRAFRALHGWWFDGNLVTVKFLRLERYHERFPEAINACIPLRPSNNLKHSLQGNLWENSSDNQID